MILVLTLLRGVWCWKTGNRLARAIGGVFIVIVAVRNVLATFVDSNSGEGGRYLPLEVLPGAAAVRGNVVKRRVAAAIEALCVNLLTVVLRYMAEETIVI